MILKDDVTLKVLELQQLKIQLFLFTGINYILKYTQNILYRNIHITVFFYLDVYFSINHLDVLFYFSYSAALSKHRKSEMHCFLFNFQVAILLKIYIVDTICSTFHSTTKASLA